MQLSYWEYKAWLSNIDFTIVGSGIVGLTCALSLKNKYPSSKILVLEKGMLPQGASTKNAGFACFGSISEIRSDIKKQSAEKVQELVKKRWDGIQLLRKNLGDTNLDFQKHGGHELFFNEHQDLYEECLSDVNLINKLLLPVFGKKAFVIKGNIFGFKNIQENYITHQFEGQIDTGKMMNSLLKLVQSKGISILNGVSVQSFVENTDSVMIKTDQFELKTKNVLIATNGFASRLINEKVKPARAQVLITKPIKNLQIKGTFHLDEGYYYFRNIDDRILFGGARNLDFRNEETYEFGKTELVQNKLISILKETILPQTRFEIDRSWSGIMGMGKEKQPIVKQLSNHIFCGVRLGGMGIAIGSLVGDELANLL